MANCLRVEVDERVLAILRDAAARNGRSVEEEALERIKAELAKEDAEQARNTSSDDGPQPLSPELE